MAVIRRPFGGVHVDSCNKSCSIHDLLQQTCSGIAEVHMAMSPCSSSIEYLGADSSSTVQRVDFAPRPMLHRGDVVGRVRGLLGTS